MFSFWNLRVIEGEELRSKWETYLRIAAVLKIHSFTHLTNIHIRPLTCARIQWKQDKYGSRFLAVCYLMEKGAIGQELHK